MCSLSNASRFGRFDSQTYDAMSDGISACHASTNVFSTYNPTPLDSQPPQL